MVRGEEMKEASRSKGRKAQFLKFDTFVAFYSQVTDVKIAADLLYLFCQYKTKLNTF